MIAFGPVPSRVAPRCLACACGVFRALAGRTELLVGYEGDAFAAGELVKVAWGGHDYFVRPTAVRGDREA